VLPALPVHCAPVFENLWPLNPCIARVAALWDEQKEKIALSLQGKVCFVRNPGGGGPWGETW